MLTTRDCSRCLQGSCRYRAALGVNSWVKIVSTSAADPHGCTVARIFFEEFSMVRSSLPSLARTWSSLHHKEKGEAE